MIEAVASREQFSDGVHTEERFPRPRCLHRQCILDPRERPIDGGGGIERASAFEERGRSVAHHSLSFIFLAGSIFVRHTFSFVGQIKIFI